MKLSARDDLRYSRLSPEELEELSRLLADSSIAVALEPYSDPEFLILLPEHLSVHHGTDRFDIPKDAVAALPESVLAVIDFADRVTRKLFGERYRIRQPPAPAASGE